MSDETTVRRWLVDNGYPEVAEKIEAVMQEWRRRGVKTRRNWWKVLAGGRNGRPLSVNGIEFPVLRVAQKRQGLPITKNAICRKRRESYPEIVPQNRWLEQ